MDNKTFYGTNNTTNITYLEFGEIDLVQGKKTIWDFRMHQKAYDWLMLGRYANDMVTYMRMNEQLGRMPISEIMQIYRDEVHHPNDLFLNLGKLCALAIVRDCSPDQELSFYELGQTIYGCIEGMVFCQNLALHLLGCSNVSP